MKLILEMCRIRLIKVPTGERHPAHFPMERAWAAHMAPGICNNSAINEFIRVISIHLGRLNQKEVMVVLHSSMAQLNDADKAAGAVSSPTPLLGICSSGSLEANEKTSTGRRCSLQACIEPAPGIHYTQSSHCHYNFMFRGGALQRREPPPASPASPGLTCPAQPAVNFSTPLDHSVLPFAPARPCGFSLEMPRLRERMRARSGLSRGDSRPPPSNFPSDDSPDPSLTSRGGKGRGRRRVGVSASAPGAATLPPPSQAPVHGGTSSRAVPPAPLRPTFRQSSQHAELKFYPTASNAILTALISVTLREEIPNFPPPSTASAFFSPASGTISAAVPVSSPLSPQEQQKNVEVTQGSMDTGDSGKEDSGEYFGCRIIEEPPSPTHD